MSLFRLSNFTSHSGLELTWKIDCDGLNTEDIETLAKVGAELVSSFGRVVGVPRGGLRLAGALQRYATSGPTLIVDDVLTTGRSMEEERAKHSGAIGLVIFARKEPPKWITPIFSLTSSN